MTAENIFSLANFVALAGWLVLIVAGRSRWAGTLVTGTVVPLLFAVLYTGLIVFLAERGLKPATTCLA